MTNLFRGVMGEESVGMNGALDPLEKEIDGVLGRGVEIGLSPCDDVKVDIRFNQEDLAVPIALPGGSSDP